MQRDELASDEELAKWLATYSVNNSSHELVSVATARCAEVRSLRFSCCGERSVAVYDTALPENAAHAELMQTEHGLDESDDIETRTHLLELFTKSQVNTAASYRQGLFSQ